ncbi:multidrug effflux MFS transporter [Solirubrobacter ginsenosidimutans]|uniref:Multidrug effflux MFS transporter n=1 Tax=Solirubrobacter ginsenosidimutans TaxID=490573 RepID=A0A9X3MNY4_9ACTN|nr:multidrug effflux MFS transporter [Solirubrobacter ginsenosidimutans]MDA0159699.1 multidrug effflux MFS transporter [Solirubrobacter ginsenosidimutans]
MPSRPALIVILGSMVAIGPLSIDMYLPGLPEITRSLHASAAAVQLTLTACVAGLACGQLVAGPLSDRLGRRRPLFAGLITYAGVSLLCALAPNVIALTGLRFLQGLAGGAGIVIGRAVVRDLYHGAAAAKLFSSLMLVTGLAPILAPVIGAQVLKLTAWQGIFVVQAALALAIVTLAALALPETLAAAKRDRGGLAATIRTMQALFAQRSFLRYALTAGLAFGALFAYISGSPFVLQDVYGLSPQAFSLAFGANGLGLVAGSQINARLVGRYGPGFLLRRALAVITAAAALLLVIVAVGGGSVWPVIFCTFVVMSSLSFVMPNATALALAEHGKVAGTASALLGVTQFLIGGLAAPLVGIGGTASALPMAIVMFTLASGAVLVDRWR